MERTVSELRKEPHWSYSAFNTYLMCPLKFRYQYIDGIPPERTGSCFAFGRAIHAALSEYAIRGVTLDEVEDIFEELFKAEINATDNLVYKPKETYDSLLNTGFDILKAALDNWDNSCTIRSVSESFSVEVPGLSKPLIGEFDMVVTDTGGDCIVDWKTSAAKWPTGKADRDLQATVFSYAYCRKYGRIPSFRFDVTTKTKTPSMEVHHTRRSAGDFVRMAFLMNRIEDAVRKGVFIPHDTGFSCADCAYSRRCKNWHRQGV
ncbi:MAG: PD-(D/E)XK nuclease family protein [Victivallaceae bacterium]